MQKYDVIIIGGGPAGLAAAIAAHDEGANVLLIEREARLGGILKQCIHDGFGLIRFKERLSGPEYAEKYIEEFRKRGIASLTMTFVIQIQNHGAEGFTVSTVNKQGILSFKSNALVLATGCRERTAKQVSIHGTRPAGLFTAGTAQHFTNLLGELPGRRCVVLGSGDIGLIMARRLTLEGAKVIGVFEAKDTPSGLTRNIHQCLYDFDIPLFLSHTVTKVFGEERLSGVEISKVDNNMKPIKGTETTIDCDTLILSVGLIPENEVAESIEVPLDSRTRGPICDGQYMTAVAGVFSCGNALHVNDLVDYVSENASLAGKFAAHYQPAQRRLIDLKIASNILYAVPQQLDLYKDNSKTILYLRSKTVLEQCTLFITVDGKETFSKKYRFMRPPEMERVVVNFDEMSLSERSKVVLGIRIE